MPTFDEKFISELKSKNNIIDVVGRYCVLKRQGSVNYWACCPLPGHTEKTPSFCVNEPGQFYHCFGCGKSGDVIKFIEETESLNFVEAVKLLAEKCGMQMPESDGYSEEAAKKEQAKRDRLFNLLKSAAYYYVKNLYTDEAENMRDYLASRGFDGKTVKTFGIGASLSYDGLVKHLKSEGFTEEEGLETGVFERSGKSGCVYDAEAGRIIIPIINQMGKVVAFGGRILEKKGMAKYKNTKETKIFNKRKILYGINNLKTLKRDGELNYVIMVEGYMDVIALYSAGFKNVVASMGTSLTLEQAKLLKRYTSKILVSYDGDAAGQNATIRSLDIFANEGFEVKIVNLPPPKDPDDVIRQDGAAAYQKLLDEAVPLIDYKFSLIKKDKNLNDITDKRKFVQESLKYISTLSDAFMREEFLKKLRDESGITYESLKRDLESGAIETAETSPPKPQGEIKPFDISDKFAKAERFILAAIIYKKNYALNYDFSLYFNHPVREKIIEAFESQGAVTPEALLSIVGEDGAEELNAVLLAGAGVFDTAAEEKYYKDSVKLVKRANLEGEINELNKVYSKETDLQKRQALADLILKKTTKLSSPTEEDS